MDPWPGNRTSSSENDLPKTTSTPVKHDKNRKSRENRKSRDEDPKFNNLEEVRIAPVKLVPTLGTLESLEQLGSLEELERFALFPNKKFDFDHCVPSKERFLTKVDGRLRRWTALKLDGLELDGLKLNGLDFWLWNRTVLKLDGPEVERSDIVRSWNWAFCNETAFNRTVLKLDSRKSI